MGEFQAGKWILMLSIYFIALISILTIMQSFALEYDIAYDVSMSGNTSLIGVESIGECTQPRYYMKDGEPQKLNVFVSNTLCEYTTANVDLSSCNAIQGCNLTTDTFLWFTGDEYCGGKVDLTAQFNISNSSYTIVSSAFGSTNVKLETLLYSQEICEFFGFTWDESSTFSDDISLTSILSTTGSLFSFDATFTQDAWVNFFLTLILFYIPLLALIIAIYFAIPFFH